MQLRRLPEKVSVDRSVLQQLTVIEDGALYSWRKTCQAETHNRPPKI